MDPRGKIAVVTGAAGGIGGAIVPRARSPRRAAPSWPLTSGPTACRATTRSWPAPLDVADADATQALVESIEAEFGPIDLWFANAGVAGGGGADAPDGTWDLQWRVNVLAHVYAARALLPGWTARGEGHLITTASMAGILTSLGDGVYAATKHAAVGFAEWLAITYADQGIKVSCICPGAVDTADAAGRRRRRRRQGQRRDRRRRGAAARRSGGPGDRGASRRTGSSSSPTPRCRRSSSARRPTRSAGSRAWPASGAGPRSCSRD